MKFIMSDFFKTQQSLLEKDNFVRICFWKIFKNTLFPNPLLVPMRSFHFFNFILIK